MNALDLVENQYKRLGIGYDGPPRALPDQLKGFRSVAIAEELKEYVDATTIEDEFDALVDLMIFTAGTLQLHGFPVEAGIIEVMKANYQKVVGTNEGKPRGKFDAPDLIKPPGFVPPNIGLALRNVVPVVKPLFNRLPNVLVLGHARHGKDTFADYLFEDKLTPTSYIAAEMIMMQAFSRIGSYYSSIEECYDDRHEHRPFWYDSIEHYNFAAGFFEPGTRLARNLLALQPCYVGMRSKLEFKPCIQDKLFDIIFWVDRSEHEPDEDPSSMTIEFDPETMIKIDNNHDLSYLRLQADLYRSKLKDTFLMI